MKLPSRRLLRVQVMPFFSATILLQARIKKSNTDSLPMRTRFQWFLSNTPRSSFKKLIVSTPSLLQGLLEEEVPTEDWYLDVLQKHTTVDSASGCLSRRRIVKMIYFKL
jgi:hypothetical protein